MHYNYNAVSLLVAAGISLLIGGFQQAGWKHRLLIVGLIGVGILCLLLAAAWPLIESALPWLANFLSAAATPSTWVVLLIVIAAYLLLGPQFKIPRLIPGPQGGNKNEYALSIETESIAQSMGAVSAHVTQLEKDVPAMGEELRAAIEKVRSDLVTAIAAVSDHYSDSVVGLKAQTIPQLEARIAEVAFAANDMRLTKTDLTWLFDWGRTRVEAALVIPNLLASKPEYQILLPPKESNERYMLLDRMKVWRAEVCSVLKYLPVNTSTDSMMIESEQYADSLIRKLKPHERPDWLDALDFRDFFIAAVKTDTLLVALHGELERIKNTTLSALSILRDKQRSRETRT